MDIDDQALVILIRKDVGFGSKQILKHASCGGRIDGRACEQFWPNCYVQRCLVHLQRNLQGRISKRWHGELASLFKRLRQAGTFEAAEEAYDTLLSFTAKRTHEGAKTLRKVRHDALRVASLEAGDLFNRSLLSTNAIENAIRNMRSVLSRPKRWRPESDMADRWLAAAMLKAEKGFHRISGYAQLYRLIERLDNTEYKGCDHTNFNN